MKFTRVAQAQGPTRTAARQLLVMLLGLVLAMGVMTLSHPLVAGAADGTEDASSAEPTTGPESSAEPEGDSAGSAEPDSAEPEGDSASSAEPEGDSASAEPEGDSADSAEPEGDSASSAEPDSAEPEGESAGSAEPEGDSAGSAEPAPDVTSSSSAHSTTSTPITDTGTTAHARPLNAGTKSTVLLSAHSPVLLGTAESFAVLGASTVTNTGPSVISGDLGVFPGCAVTGEAQIVITGTIHKCDAVAQQAQADLLTAYNAAAGQTPTAQLATQLGGQTLTAGVYDSASGTFQLTGILTLDAQGDPDAVFIFQTNTTLVTASSSRVLLINGAQACNVFWQIGSSATLGTSSSMVGNVMADQSVTATTGATVQGSLLALNAAVTLDTNTITRSPCAADNGENGNGDGENGDGENGGGENGGGDGEGGGGGENGGGDGENGNGNGGGVSSGNGGDVSTSTGDVSTVSASAQRSSLPLTGLDGRSPIVIGVVMLLVGAALRMGTRRLERVSR